MFVPWAGVCGCRCWSQVRYTCTSDDWTFTDYLRWVITDTGCPPGDGWGLYNASHTLRPAGLPARLLPGLLVWQPVDGGRRSPAIAWRVSSVCYHSISVSLWRLHLHFTCRRTPLQSWWPCRCFQGPPRRTTHLSTVSTVHRYFRMSFKSLHASNSSRRGRYIRRWCLSSRCNPPCCNTYAFLTVLREPLPRLKFSAR